MKYPCHMNTKNWKFVKDGLDDFRDGLPPSHDDIILQVILFCEQFIRMYSFLYSRIKVQVLHLYSIQVVK